MKKEHCAYYYFSFPFLQSQIICALKFLIDILVSFRYENISGGKYLFLLIHLLEEIEQQRYKGNCGVFDYDTGSSIGK